MTRKRIAIVGSGVGGLVTAHLLDPIHDIVLYEADHRLGGHTNTIVVEDPTAGPLAVDTGFIVHNDRNYPQFTRLLTELGIATIDSEMSFAVTDRASGFSYRATNLNTLFADRRNIVDRRLWRMLADIARFYRQGRALLAEIDADPETGTDQAHRLDDLAIGDLLAAGRYSAEFVDLHLVPMGAAVWSTSAETFESFPALPLLRFLDNHGLLSVGNRPQWRTVDGGARTYVEAIVAGLRGDIRLGTPVHRIIRRAWTSPLERPDGARAATLARSGGSETTVATRPRTQRHLAEGQVAESQATGGRVIIETDDGAAGFDHVVLATHSDQSLRLLDDPTEAEREVLGAIRYQPNRATLHTDTSLLPPKRRAWAAWNYDVPPPPSWRDQAREREQNTVGPSVTYDLTTLQRLPGECRYLLTLNAEDRVSPDKVIEHIDYAHPVFDCEAMAAQRRVVDLNGVNNTWFCGAWQGYGFHEDGVVAAARVARSLGATW